MPPSDEVRNNPAAPLAGRWTMTLRGFLTNNIVVGCAFGGLGLAMVTIRERYEVDATTAAMCMSAIMLASGLTSPFAATLIGRIGIRSTMTTGAMLTIAGYLLLAFAPTIHVVLAAYALIGIGVATCGSFPAILLAHAWFQPSPGRAVGFVNMSLGVALVPLLMESVLGRFGLRTFYLTFAVAVALIVPVIQGISEAPRRPPQAARMSGLGDALIHDRAMPATALLRSPSYWTLVLSTGILVAISLAGLSHIFAFGTERGLSANQAALMTSVLAGASMVGAFSSGMLCDRIGGALTLMLTGLGFASGWTALSLIKSPAPMLAAVSLIGLCAGGVYPAFSVLAGQLYGRATLPRAMGLYGLLVLPMTILMPPLAGLSRDETGSYQLMTMAFVAIGCATAAVFFAMSHVHARRDARTDQARTAA